MKIISVIIPVYNVEKYLPECLDSVINQTYSSLQIVLVDDGSTDNSGKICDDYAKKDNRITVVHQANQGAGAAKNVGLDLVEGEYLSLIDSDDYIDLDFYEILVSRIEKHNADVVQCLFRNTFVNNSYDRKYNFLSTSNRVLSSKKYLFEMLYDWKYAVFWNKLFNTSLLGETRFPVGRKIDDDFFTYKLICNAKRIVNINDVLYNYRMRQSSVMNVNDKDRLMKDRIDCFVERYNYIKNAFPILSYDYYYHFSDFLLYTYNSTSSVELKEYLEKHLKDYPYKPNNTIRKIRKRLKLHNLGVNSGIDNNKYILFD